MNYFGSGRISLWTLSIAVLLVGAASAPAAKAHVIEEQHGGRGMFVCVPARLPAPGARALVIVLHGGLGNAGRVESKQSENGLNMDDIAERFGFVIAYLNGTPVTQHLGADKLGWNAGGGCCGLPARNNVDDVEYIKTAIDYLVGQFGIDRGRIFGIGHSNGAMMTLRVMCETGIYAAAVSISGPLNLDSGSCTAARGRRILALHGAEDATVPIAGGRGSRGISGAVYSSEERTRRRFVDAGASFDLQVVTGADHKLDNIQDAIQRAEGVSIAKKAVQFFGLLNPNEGPSEAAVPAIPPVNH